jgi:hypothetical protein
MKKDIKVVAFVVGAVVFICAAIFLAIGCGTNTLANTPVVEQKEYPTIEKQKETELKLEVCEGIIEVMSVAIDACDSMATKLTNDLTNCLSVIEDKHYLPK